MRVMLETNIKTTWHVNPSSDLESRDECLNAHQGRNLMAGAALRVWEELYLCKKPAIEEVFKVTLATPSPHQKAPDLMIVRDQVFESSSKLWINYVEMERKATYRVPWELHNQIQSKIHKVTGGLTRLASRTKVRKEETLRIKVRMGKKQALQWMINHVVLMRYVFVNDSSLYRVGIKYGTKKKHNIYRVIHGTQTFTEINSFIFFDF